MARNDSVTQWIDQAKTGDEVAAQALWERYYAALVRYARGKLEGTPRRMADEEDVAASAFASFCRGAEAGRFPHVRDRDSLWRLLLSMTAQKAIDLRRYNSRQKRQILGETALGVARPGEEGPDGISQVVGDGPTPDFATMVAQECGRLLEQLDEPLRDLAVQRMEGYTVSEIAEKSGCSVRTVERLLRTIRKKWEREGQKSE